MATFLAAMYWAWENRKTVAVAFVLCLVFSCGCYSGCRCDRAVHAPGPVGATGWLKDPADVERVLATMPRPEFATAAPLLVANADPKKDALLYEIAAKQLGHPLEAYNQNPVGCCVGEGWALGHRIKALVDRASGKAVEDRDISHSFIYAASRVTVNDGSCPIRPTRRNPYGDGSRGAWAAKACSTIGVVSCEEAGETNQKPGHARQWAYQGPPKALLEKAGAHKSECTASRVKSATDVMAALQNGYPVVVCFSNGFAMTRDKDGFCEAQGEWGHCQCCAGYRADKRGFLLIQSWGENVPDGPTAKGQPGHSFWVKWEVMDQIAQEGDSFAISSFDGFPAREIDFFVRREPKRRTFLAEFALAY